MHAIVAHNAPFFNPVPRALLVLHLLVSSLLNAGSFQIKARISETIFFVLFFFNARSISIDCYLLQIYLSTSETLFYLERARCTDLFTIRSEQSCLSRMGRILYFYVYEGERGEFNKGSCELDALLERFEILKLRFEKVNEKL